MSADNFPKRSSDRLAAKDELLQVMYWLRGEGLARDAAAADLSRWIGMEPLEIHPLLVELAEAKLVEIVEGSERQGAPRFRLTAAGVVEGGRRFADEFSEMIKPGHYECSDPNCECRRTGNPADCLH